MDIAKEHNQRIKDNVQILCTEPSFVSDKEKDTRAYVLEKTLRISSATLALAALLDTLSPVRASLERTSVGLIERAAEGLTARTARTELLANMRSLSALLDAAALAGVLAPVSVGIVTRELGDLALLLTESGWAQGRVAHSAHVLAMPSASAAFMDDPLPQRTQTYKRHDTGYEVTDTGREHVVPYAQAPDMQKDVRVNATAHYRERVQDSQKDRRATILGLLQRKDKISVRDVAAVIKDCSEKTLQRELLALVGQGVLVKDGERRWSTYRLA